ncbi:hypothetical protein [Prochlorococcus marinus]|nr:hypothetical protein [Prochlorococcus marinus]
MTSPSQSRRKHFLAEGMHQQLQLTSHSEGALQGEAHRSIAAKLT